VEENNRPTSRKLADLRYVYDSIYLLNYNELIQYITFINQDDDTFHLMTSMGNSPEVMRQTNVFTQRLFNFLSGFYIVYDQCQSMINTCTDADFRKTYNSALNKYKSECNYLLIKDLRTIITHISIPAITWLTRFNAREQTAYIIPLLKISRLLEYERISPELRDTLENETKDELAVHEFVQNHHNSFHSFYTTIFDKIPEVWSAEMKKAYEDKYKGSDALASYED